jgi:polysaccharide deacetylase 2 family uncharacterized protein YibQ
MRGFIVLAGMLVAAAVTMLVWLDATGQLRPWLTTTPTVVFELDPAPDDSGSDGDAALTAAATEAAVAPAAPVADDETTQTAESAAAATDAATAVDFGAGAVALSDLPIADPEAESSGDAAAATTTGADTVDAAAMDAEATVPDAAATTAAPESEAAEDATGTLGAGEAVAEVPAVADDAAGEPTAATAAGEVILDAATPEPKPDATAFDPTALQTAALPRLPYDPNLPWRLYAAPFPEGEPRPRIAIVFVSLGLSDGATEAIIQQLPGAVTLAFSPYSRKLQDWIPRARAKGHEVLVELPMEPLNYPTDDPGPLALLDDRPMEDNVTRLDGILDRAEGAVGVAALMGSRFSGNEELMRPILLALGERGFLYVDNGTAPVSVVPALSQRIAVPIVVNDHFLDTEASRIAIDGRLQQIERIARSEGAAVAFASPYPITIERLLAWIPTLEAKGFVLAPVTAVVGHQDLP